MPLMIFLMIFAHPYDNPDRIDITINDRRNDIYQNVTFCQNGCIYEGIDFEYMFAKCLCNSRFFQDEESNKTNIISNKEIINFKTLTKVFIENLLSFNIEILRCYKLVLNVKYLIHNIGILLYIIDVCFTNYF